MKNRLIPLVSLLFFITGCATSPVHIAQRPAPVNPDVAGAPFEIALTGDVMGGRKLEPFMKEKGPGYPFELVRDSLRGCRIIFGNLESPLIYPDRVEKLKENGKKPVYLYSDEKFADSLAAAGYNIVSIANNHILDYGQEGVSQTVEILNSRNIGYYGIRRGDLSLPNAPLVKTINGVRVGFLCYSQVSARNFYATASQWGTIPALLNLITIDIKKYRKDVDLLFVYIHWGREYMPVKKAQVYMAHQLVNAGADFIFGSHTHIFQDIEKYNGKYIFYGLGNFCFDLDRDDAKSGAIVKMGIAGKKIKKVTVEPVYLRDYRPEPVTDTVQSEEFFKKLKLVNVKEGEIR